MSDAQLVVNHLGGGFQIKEDKLKTYYEVVKEDTPRENNTYTDAMTEQIWLAMAEVHERSLGTMVEGEAWLTR